MSYTITDRRGGQNPREVCRVCGAGECHTVEYGRPTMQCVQFLRDEIEGLRNKVGQLRDEISSIRHGKYGLSDLSDQILAITAERAALQKLCGEMVALLQLVSDRQPMPYFAVDSVLTKYRTLNPVPDSEK